MKKMRNICVRILAAVLVGLIATAGRQVFAAPKPAAGTHIADSLEGILTAEKSPYLVTADIIVSKTKTLSIRPGVVLRFSRNTKLIVEGTLESQGEILNTIKFSGLANDTFPGAWDGIYFTVPESKGMLANCVIEYAVTGVYCAASQVTLHNNIISHHLLYGIYCLNAISPIVTNNLIRDSYYGIICYNHAQPHIQGNVLHNLAMAGIYCFSGSSPHIEQNIITTCGGTAIFCLDQCLPLVENNLLADNGNGIFSSRSAPIIMYNSINHNRRAGIIAFASSPVIESNNIFGQQSNIIVINNDSLVANGNWWGEKSVITVLDSATGQPKTMLEKSSLQGSVIVNSFLTSPCSLAIDQPKAVTSLELLEKTGTGAAATAEFGDQIMIKMTGVDGSALTRDHAEIKLYAPDKHSITVLLEETDINSGVYQQLLTIDKKFTMTDTALVHNPRSLFSVVPLVGSARTTLTVVGQKPVLEAFTVMPNTRKDRISTVAPLQFSWNYCAPGEKPQPQTQFEFQLTDTATFNEGNLISHDIGNGTILKYLYHGPQLKEARKYYARLRVRGYSNWSDWDTVCFTTNTRPPAPACLFPQNNQVLAGGLWPGFTCQKTADNDQDPIQYRFELYQDQDLKKLVDKGTGTEKYLNYTWRSDRRLNENQEYWWRICTDDGYETSAWTPLRKVTVNMVIEPIQPFALQYPRPEEIIDTESVTFAWEPTFDPDPNEPVTYTLLLSTNPDFSNAKVISNITTNSYQMNIQSNYGTLYYWKVKAVTKDSHQWCNTKYDPYYYFIVAQPFIVQSN